MTDNNMQLITLGVMLVMQLVVLVMGFFMYRSIPESAVKQLLDAAEKTAARTTSPMDDEAVRLARSLATLLNVLQTTSPTTPVLPIAPEIESDDVKKK